MTAATERKPLGQLLIERGHLQPKNLERALQEQQCNNHQKLLGEILIELHACTEDQIIEALALAYGVPYARITPRIVDAKIIGQLPREFIERHQVLPLFLVDGVLTIAVTEPANVFLVEEIERLAGHPVQVVAATERDIKATLRTYRAEDRAFAIDELVDQAMPDDFHLVEAVDSDNAEADMADDESVVRLVNYVLFNSVQDSASEIHIEPGDQALRIRYRIDGRLAEKLRPPHTMHAAIAMRLKTMAGLDPAQRRLPQDGAIHIVMGRRPLDLHITSIPGKFGEKIVLRLIDNDNAAANLEKLGFNYDTLKLWRRLLSAPSGLLLVSGPAGSGKTNTLYACLRELNAGQANICTIENRVELPLAGVNQFQTRDADGFTYAAALQSLLAQSPDVIMVGDLPDSDTAKAAAQAALTGHLVLSTLHTPDAASAIARLYHLGVEPYFVGGALTGILAQRLVRKLCQACKEAYSPTIHERRQLEKILGPVETFFRPKGCPRCRNLGFTGRIGIFELLAFDDHLSEKISQGPSLAELRDAARTWGLKPLRLDGLEKVKAGITTLEEVYRVTA